MKKMLDLVSERYMKWIIELTNQQFQGDIQELRMQIAKQNAGLI